MVPFFKGVIEWFIYIFSTWWDWDIYSHCKKAAWLVSNMLLANRLWIYDHRRCFFPKLSIPVISALHPGRLTAGSPTNHPSRKNRKWSEPNLHEDMFQPLIFRGVAYQKQISEEIVFFVCSGYRSKPWKPGNASGMPRQISSRLYKPNRGLGISQMVVNCKGTVPSKCRNSTFWFRIFFVICLGLKFVGWVWKPHIMDDLPFPFQTHFGKDAVHRNWFVCVLQL